jgi:large subunit ribosomal protein L17
MCIIEFVDFNEAYTLGVTPAPASEAKPKTRRSRKKATDAVEDATVVEKKKAAPKAPKAAAAKASAAKGAKKTNVGKKM